MLLATANQLGLPSEAVALLVSIDFFANAGRTALNVVGNALAATIITKTEGAKLLVFTKIKKKEGPSIRPTRKYISSTKMMIGQNI